MIRVLGHPCQLTSANTGGFDVSNESVIRKAEFDPKVCTYWMLSGEIVFVVTVVGIPLLLLWFTIGNITDLVTVQGPLMRLFYLRTLTVETAGQSGQGALVSLTGIVDAESFRETVLAQREVVGATNLSAPSSSDDGPNIASGSDTLLLEIRDSLHRLEGLLARS